jgi:MYXO-CTERM domain-containing protein
MMSRLSICGLAAAIAAGGVGAASCAAAIYTSNGFEAPTYTSGKTLNAQNGWRVLDGSAVVETDKVFGGSGQAIEAQNVATPTAVARSIASYQKTREDNIWVDVEVFLPAASDASANPSLWLRDSGNTIRIDIEMDATDKVVGFANSHVDRDQWNRLTVYVDVVHEDWDLYMNGNLVGENVAFRPAKAGTTDPHDIDKYQLAWTAKAGSSGDGFYGDNFQITTDNPLPEPAGLGLLAAGGLMLMRRRR